MGGRARLRSRLRDLVEEWVARRAGRRHVSSDIRQQARDVAGATGWLYSRGWDEVARVEPTYLRSFREPRVPPSLHVSARDRRRDGIIVPIAERCIEDFGHDDRPGVGPWSTAELTGYRPGTGRDRPRSARKAPRPR
jgi:hypothetical protein